MKGCDIVGYKNIIFESKVLTVESTIDDLRKILYLPAIQIYDKFLLLVRKLGDISK